jgi:hypothetical protein
MQGCGAISAPDRQAPLGSIAAPGKDTARTQLPPAAVDKWPAAARLLAVAASGHLPTAPISLIVAESKTRPP